jgi:hypothetical protein
MPPSSSELWQAMPWYYLLTVALETPVLLLALSARHPWPRRLFAGFWLTACTYPIVWILLPLTVWHWWGYGPYIVIAETFAPLAECFLFWWAFSSPKSAEVISGQPSSIDRNFILQDCAAIVIANLASFVLGGFLASLFVN